MNAHDNTKETITEANDLIELAEALASEDGWVRQRAREKLVRAGGPAVDLLIDTLGDKREQVRWEAAKALLDAADSRAAPALVEHLEDELFDVRWLAAEALVVLGEKALPELLNALKNRSDKLLLREGAHHVLKKIENKQTTAILHPIIEALDGLEPELTVPVKARAALEAVRNR